MRNNMLGLYQYCNKCKTERTFNPKTLECLTCKKKKDENTTDRDKR